MEASNHAEASVALLGARIERLADEVGRSANAPLPQLGALAKCSRWITTGVGGSEVPARFLSRLLRSGGIAAEFVPLSAFLAEPPPAEVCVVVSQGVSPNARLPLARRSAYAHMMLVTTAPSSEHVAALERSHGCIVAHGPNDEVGLILRVLGPAAACAIALRIALAVTGDAPSWAAHVEEIPSAIRRADARAREALQDIEPRKLFDVVGIVAAADLVVHSEALGHKLLEGLGCHVPTWDMCSVVHGPLQSFYDRAATLVSFQRAGDDVHAELVKRLAEVLRAEHTLLRWTTDLPGPLALFEMDAQLDRLLLTALRAHPRDLVDWPGKGCDGPLYSLGE